MVSLIECQIYFPLFDLVLNQIGHSLAESKVSCCCCCCKSQSLYTSILPIAKHSYSKEFSQQLRATKPTTEKMWHFIVHVSFVRDTSASDFLDRNLSLYFFCVYLVITNLLNQIQHLICCCRRCCCCFCCCYCCLPSFSIQYQVFPHLFRDTIALRDERKQIWIALTMSVCVHMMYAFCHGENNIMIDIRWMACEDCVRACDFISSVE